MIQTSHLLSLLECELKYSSEDDSSLLQKHLLTAIKSLIIDCHFLSGIYLPLKTQLEEQGPSDSNAAWPKTLEKCLNALQTLQENHVRGVADLIDILERGRPRGGPSLSSFHRLLSSSPSLILPSLFTEYSQAVDNLYDGSLQREVRLTMPSREEILGKIRERGREGEREGIKNGVGEDRSKVTLKSDIYDPARKIGALSMKDEPKSSSNYSRRFFKAKETYGIHSSHDLKVSGNPSKIEVSHGARYIFYGGETLGMIETSSKENRDKTIKNKGQLIDHHRCCTIKALPSGDLLVNDFKTWDLILYDNTLTEFGRLNGDKASENKMYKFFKSIYTRYADDSRFMIWLKSFEDVCVVDTHSFQGRAVKDFWTLQDKLVRNTQTNEFENPEEQEPFSEERVAEPIAVVASKCGSIILGIGDIENRYQTIHYADIRVGNVLIFNSSQVIPRGRFY